MKVPETFIPNKTLDGKVKALLSKKGLYEKVVNKYGFFKPDQTDDMLNCYFAIKSILKDEGYKITHGYKSVTNIRILLLRASSKKEKLLNNDFCLEGYTHDQKLVIVSPIRSMDEAKGLANRLYEELKLDLKLKQYIGRGVWADVEPN